MKINTEKERIRDTVKGNGFFLKVAPEERKMILGNLQKCISVEGMGCVVCPCYTSCTRCKK